MFRPSGKQAAGAASVVALAAALAACGSSSTGSETSASGSGSSSSMPTVTMMVGGIDKQIYLPYQLAQTPCAAPRRSSSWSPTPRESGIRTGIPA